MKFGTEMVLKGGRFWGGGELTRYPHLHGGMGVWGAIMGSRVPLEPQLCVLVKTL